MHTRTTCPNTVYCEEWAGFTFSLTYHHVLRHLKYLAAVYLLLQKS